MATLEGTWLKDRYRVDELIGRGGMAEVYKVWDSKKAVYLDAYWFYRTEFNNPTGPSSSSENPPTRVVHGGNWYWQDGFNTVVFLDWWEPVGYSTDIGFRCVVEVED